MVERRTFSECCHSFRAEPHTFYIYHQYTIYPAIKFAKTNYYLIIKKDNGKPIDTSIIVPVRGVV
jgi:hypothetical protein